MRSAWEFHQRLTAQLKRRGFSHASIIALRVLTQGVESGLTIVLLAFHQAIEDTWAEWKRGV